MADHDRDRDTSDSSIDELRERYQELLEELRIILPGVQVFFAFLLTAPFSDTFSDLDRLGRLGYATSVTCAAIAVIVLAAPTAYHHVHERQARADRIRTTIRLKFVGLVLTGAAAASGLFVVMRLVFGSVAGWVALVGVVGCSVVLWFLLPARARARPVAGL